MKKPIKYSLKDIIEDNTRCEFVDKENLCWLYPEALNAIAENGKGYCYVIDEYTQIYFATLAQARAFIKERSL